MIQQLGGLWKNASTPPQPQPPVWFRLHTLTCLKYWNVSSSFRLEIKKQHRKSVLVVLWETYPSKAQKRSPMTTMHWGCRVHVRLPICPPISIWMEYNSVRWYFPLFGRTLVAPLSWHSTFYGPCFIGVLLFMEIILVSLRYFYIQRKSRQFVDSGQLCVVFYYAYTCIPFVLEKN